MRENNVYVCCVQMGTEPVLFDEWAHMVQTIGLLGIVEVVSASAAAAAAARVVTVVLSST